MFAEESRLLSARARPPFRSSRSIQPLITPTVPVQWQPATTPATVCAPANSRRGLNDTSTIACALAARSERQSANRHCASINRAPCYLSARGSRHTAPLISNLTRDRSASCGSQTRPNTVFGLSGGMKSSNVTFPILTVRRMRGLHDHTHYRSHHKRPVRVAILLKSLSASSSRLFTVIIAPTRPP